MKQKAGKCVPISDHAGSRGSDLCMVQECFPLGHIMRCISIGRQRNGEDLTALDGDGPIQTVVDGATYNDHIKT